MDDLTTKYTFFAGRPRDERYIKNINAVRKELVFDNIMKCLEQLEIAETKKIRIRFFFWGGAYQWTSIESVAAAFFEDSDFDVLVVSVNDNYEPKKQVVEKTGIRIVDSNKYDIRADLPDIVIFNNQINFEKYNNLQDVKMVISMPTVLVNGWILKDQLGDMMEENIIGSGIVSPDYYLAEKIIYDSFAPEVLKNKTWFECGNPKFDLIYKNVTSASPAMGTWKKLRGKKVILWAFDHNWTSTSFSFDLYFKHFINWFAQQNEMALIIRPHQVLIYEMYDKGIWPRDGEKKIKEIFDNTANIIWDDSPNYGGAYAVCDAIVTDINCGITISALPLEKPMAVLFRYDGNHCAPHYPDVISSLYNIKSPEELNEFLWMVKDGQDPMLKDRKELIEKYIANFDGKNGQRIKEFITKEYFKKYGKIEKPVII